LLCRSPSGLKELRVIDAGRARCLAGEATETEIHLIGEFLGRFHAAIGDRAHERNPSPGAVTFLARLVPGRAGRQAKAAMDTLLDDRVFERLQGVVAVCGVVVRW
jgi:Ser/Thr protein kinase RdoA (MazF antagonist)